MFLLSGPAHAVVNDEYVGGMLPLVVFGAVAAFALYLIARAKWRKFLHDREVGSE